MKTNQDIMDAMLDALIRNDGTITGPWGRTLRKLACETWGEDVAMQSPEYYRTSRAMLALESMDLITVDRAYSNGPQKASIVTRVSLSQ